MTQIDTPDGASAADIIEALYGLFFLDAAFQQNKPVWGTCHGAQIGYVHAGGRLGRLFEYEEDGYDVELKRKGSVDGKEETWHINKCLATHERGGKYFNYGRVVRPMPEFFKDEKDHEKKMEMNTDFEHSFCLAEPVPEGIQVISYHPLSEYREMSADEKDDSRNEEFKKVLKNLRIIDAYKYRTMLGTQYHPQYTYDQLDMAILFEYLLKQLANVVGSNH